MVQIILAVTNKSIFICKYNKNKNLGKKIHDRNIKTVDFVNAHFYKPRVRTV